MAKSRLSVLLFLAACAAALLVFVFFSSGSICWAGISTSLLILGFGLGLGWRQIQLPRYVVPGDQETSAPDFSAELLATTINEMREGLLVIDADMRVLATNRVAQDLLSNAETSITSRRLTELTRNPAIYDAFLDGVRGTDRVGVKVETFGPDRRVFDLRVVPLRGRGAITGAVGVFFYLTML
jgi:PAS domain-containing protein